MCVCRCVCVFLDYTHHVNELGYGEAKLDDDYIRCVWDGSGPLVVANEKLLEEIILCMRVGLLVSPRYQGWEWKQKPF